MIEVKNLTKRYSGGRPAVKDISFKIDKGEIVGFLGPNGAGKSTTMNILTGYLSATSGSVRIGGFDVLQQPNKAKAKIGFLPEQPPLYIDMTVEEYLNFVFELKKVRLDRARHIEEVCRLVKIEEVYRRVIRNLSKGYRQRVGIAQALIGNPEVLILDEPTVGLDPKQIVEIRSLIKRLGKDHTVILSSHILSEIQAVCERIIIISNGSIVADDQTENLSKGFSENSHLTVQIEGDKEECLKALRGIDSVSEVTVTGQKDENIFEYYIETKKNADRRREVFGCAVKNRFVILAMQDSSMTLEEIFMKLTSTAAVSTDKTQKTKPGKEG